MRHKPVWNVPFQILLQRDDTGNPSLSENEKNYYFTNCDSQLVNIVAFLKTQFLENPNPRPPSKALNEYIS